MTHFTPPPSIGSNPRSDPQAGPASDNLASRSVRAAKAGLALSVARVALQFVSQIVMARLLGPDPFGVFGLALVAYTFTVFVSEFGFGMVLMQKPSLTQRDIRLVFTWQITLGVIAAVLLFTIAPALGHWYGDDRISHAVRWMAAGCLLNAAGATGTALLMRDLDFRSIGLIDVAGYAIGYLVVGLTLAFNGFGVEALVCAWLVHALVKTVATLIRRPHPARPAWTGEAGPLVLATGSRVLLTNIVNWLLQNVDRVIIGRLLNTNAVGLYNVGNNLATTAGTLLVNALQPTFISGGARVQDDPQRLGRAWSQIFATICVVAAPAFVTAATIAEPVIRLLYGDRWSGAAAVLTALLLGMPFYLAAAMATPVLWNRGVGHHEPLLQLPVLLAGAAALWLFTPLGVGAAAWVVTGIYATRAIVLVSAATRVIGLPPSALSGPLVRGLLLAALAALLAWGCLRIVTPLWPTAWWLQVVAGGLGPALVLSALVLARPSLLGHDATTMVLRIMPVMRRWLERETAAR